MDWAGIVGACVAVTTLTLALLKVLIGNLKGELAARDAEQERQISALQTASESHAERIADTRQELHSDYAKRAELEALETGLREDVNKVFDSINGVSRDLNQMIGEFRAWAQVRNGASGE